MQEPGLNKIYRTGNRQMDVLVVEVERARSAASSAVSRAELAAASVERLESQIQRHERRTNGSVAALLFILMFVFCLLLVRSY
jgi:hypothetical protein